MRVKNIQIPFLFIIFLLLCNRIFSQTYMINLHDEDFIIKGYSFYVDTVIDVRERQDNIGFVQVGLFNSKRPANLSGGAAASIQKYLRNQIEKGTNAEPITVLITHLDISENTTFRGEFGNVQINLEFYRHKDSLLGKVFGCSAVREESTMNDITSTHEKRIREVILDCMDRFHNYKWQNDSIVYKKWNEIKTNSKPAVFNQPLMTIGDSIEIRGHAFYKNNQVISLNSLLILMKMQKKDQASYNTLKKAYDWHFSSLMFGLIGGLTLGTAVANALNSSSTTTKQDNTGFFIFGASAALITIPLNQISFSLAKKAVKQFNSSLK